MPDDNAHNRFVRDLLMEIGPRLIMHGNLPEQMVALESLLVGLIALVGEVGNRDPRLLLNQLLFSAPTRLEETMLKGKPRHA
jgi:hypothetical protein